LGQTALVRANLAGYPHIAAALKAAGAVEEAEEADADDEAEPDKKKAPE